MSAAATERLVALLQQEGPDGPRFSDEEVLAFLPVAVLGAALGDPSLEIPDALMLEVGQLAIDAGIDGAASPEDTAEALATYLEDRGRREGAQRRIRPAAAGAGERRGCRRWASLSGVPGRRPNAHGPRIGRAPRGCGGRQRARALHAQDPG
jgi:hypothetical protein